MFSRGLRLQVDERCVRISRRVTGEEVYLKTCKMEGVKVHVFKSKPAMTLLIVMVGVQKAVVALPPAKERKTAGENSGSVTFEQVATPTAVAA